jgi:hypothetical protein
MSQQAFADYHLYTLERRTTIANAETKQLALLHGIDVPVTKRYVVEGQQWVYRNRHHPGTPLKGHREGPLRLHQRRRLAARQADARRRRSRLSGRWRWPRSIRG